MMVLVRDLLELSPFLGYLFLVCGQRGTELTDYEGHRKGNVDHTEKQNDRTDRLSQGSLGIEISVTNRSHGDGCPPTCV